MATSHSLRIVSPLKLWLTINLLLLIFVGLVFWQVVEVDRIEQERLLRYQVAAVARTMLERNDDMDFRRSIEKIGPHFPSLYIKIVGSENLVQELGRNPDLPVCVEESVPNRRDGTSAVLQFCEERRPVPEVVWVLCVVYLILSLVIFLIVGRLERGAWLGLRQLLKDAGLPIGSDAGLVGALSEIRDQSQLIVAMKKKQIEMAKAAAVGELAARVAHDIRSPLSALSIVSSKLSFGADSLERKVFDEAVKSINGIAKDLLDRRRSENPPSTPSATVVKWAEEIVAVKLTEIQPKIEIRVLNELVENVSCSIGEVSFKRIISNLINNSSEARATEVEIRIASAANSISFELKDNGLGEKAFKKEESNGIGLSSARDQIYELGGQISSSYIKGSGFSVMIVLPAV